MWSRRRTGWSWSSGEPGDPCPAGPSLLSEGGTPAAGGGLLTSSSWRTPETAPCPSASEAHRQSLSLERGSGSKDYELIFEEAEQRQPPPLPAGPSSTTAGSPCWTHGRLALTIRLRRWTPSSSRCSGPGTCPGPQETGRGCGWTSRVPHRSRSGPSRGALPVPGALAGLRRPGR